MTRPAGHGREDAKGRPAPCQPRLANTLVVERTWSPDRKSMLAALRVLLGLPKAPPGWIEELGK